MPPRKVDVRFIENARSRAARYAKRSKGLQNIVARNLDRLGRETGSRVVDRHPGERGSAPIDLERDHDPVTDPRRPTFVPDPRTGSSDPGSRNAASTPILATMLQKKASELSTLCGVPVALVCAPAPAAGAAAGAPLVWESEEGVLERYRAAAVPPDARARHTHRSYLEAELGKERAKLARARPGALPDWDQALNDMAPDEAREVLEAIDTALQAARDRMAALGLPADDRLALELVAAPDDDDDASDDADYAPQHLALDMGTGYAGYQTHTRPCHGGSNDHGGQLEQFLMQPEHDLECVGGGSSYVGPVDGTEAPGGYGDNAGYTSWNAPMPVGYYPYFADGALAPEHYSSAQDLTGGDYADTLPLEHTMGMDENFAYPHMDNTYAAHWHTQDFQRSHTGTGTGQYPGTRGSGQAFHYLY
ncbi:uncharacterized protein [Lolium perenne]|uniref:uncharacterized protein n=1 Tax=Lolium perenne TaxID=4522 RepID=UPI003A9A5C5F